MKPSAEVNHELKTWPQYFIEVVKGNKTFELRRNDRDFKLDDFVLLKEYSMETKSYSGRECGFKISYILDLDKYIGELDEKYVVLGFKEILYLNMEKSK